MLVVGDVPDDPLTVTGVGPQPLLLAPLVVADHRVGGVEDRLGRAVVLLQQDRGGVGEVLLEVEDVADVGPAEGVDRLVRVTDHHQLGGLDALGVRASGVGALLLHLAGAELVDEGVLRVVGVLVLVDQHVPEPAPVGLPHLGELLEEVDGEHDQVVEVERVGLAQPALVGRVDGRVGLLEVVAGVLGRVLGVAQLVLLVRDPVQHRAGLVAPRVEVEVVADQGHQTLLVGGVVDREVGLEALAPDVQCGDLLAQDAHAGGVEGRDPHDPGALADQLLHPLLHLGRRLVGEGDGEDRAGVGSALGDQPRDPSRQHAGLARTGAGDDEQRGALVDDGRALGLVEALEELVGGGSAPGRARLGGRDRLEAGKRDRLAHLGPQPTAGHRRPRRPIRCRRSPRRRRRRCCRSSAAGAAPTAPGGCSACAGSPSPAPGSPGRPRP